MENFTRYLPFIFKMKYKLKNENVVAEIMPLPKERFISGCKRVISSSCRPPHK